MTEHEQTRRNQVEENITRMATVVRDSNDAITIQDFDGRIIAWNRGAEVMYGYTEKEALQMNIGLLTAPSKISEQKDFIRRLMADEQITSFETQRLTKDGRILDVWLTVTELVDYTGKPIGVASTERDITERKRTEDTLKEREERYRTLFTDSRDAIMVLDPEKGMIAGNPAVLKLFGYSNESEFVSQQPADLSPDYQPDWSLSSEKAEKMILRALETGSHLFDWTHRRTDGTIFPATVLLSRFSNHGKFMLQATIRDITEQKSAEKQKNLMEIQLRNAQKMESIGQLAAGIAHEVNTPMQFVGDNMLFLKEAFEDIIPLIEKCRLLRSDSEPPAQQLLLADLCKSGESADLEYFTIEIPKAISQSLEGIERISKIVRAMKDFSHPDPNEEKTLTDLNKAIETTATVAHNEWKYVAEMKMDLDPTLPLVSCLPGQVHQVFLNLIVNAAHAIKEVIGTEPGMGQITFRTRSDGKFAEIRVSDTGTGIPEKHRQKIFEPFFTTKKVGQGTGQGLAIAYNAIVKKHGGSLTFETETGHGTTFIIRLPLDRPEGEKGQS